MAQFSTFLPVLLLLTIFNPIVCPSSRISERHDRAPYIETSGHSPQYLADSFALEPARSKKAEIPMPPIPQTSVASNNYQADQHKTDNSFQSKIKTVFNTDFGPGLHLFNNTAPINSTPSHSNSYDNDAQMHADQPYAPSPPSLHMPSPSSSLSSSAKSGTEPELFKVQRGPTGKLNVVYPNGEIVDQAQKTESTSQYNGKKETSKAKSPTISPIIHFPTEEPVRDEINYTVNSDDCVDKDGEPNGKQFCTKLRNYPEKSLLEEVIKKKFSNLDLFFGEDMVLPQNISQRMNNEANEEYLCKSRSRVIYPEAGVTKDYSWLIIVNTENYKQGIKIEECIDEGSTCGESSGLTLPNRYTATCKQSYIYRSLVAYANNTIKQDQFKMPSCCKCVLKVKETFDP